MKKNRGNILVLSLTGIALIAISVAIYFYLQIPKDQSVKVGNYTKTIPDSKPADPTANWKTYTDKNFNYSFKYPSTWDMATQIDMYQVSVGLPNDWTFRVSTYSNSDEIPVLESPCLKLISTSKTT